MDMRGWQSSLHSLVPHRKGIVWCVIILGTLSMGLQVLQTSSSTSRFYAPRALRYSTDTLRHMYANASAILANSHLGLQISGTDIGVAVPASMHASQNITLAIINNTTAAPQSLGREPNTKPIPQAAPDLGSINKSRSVIKIVDNTERRRLDAFKKMLVQSQKSPKVVKKPLGPPTAKFHNVTCDHCFLRKYLFLNMPGDICGANLGHEVSGLDMLIAVLTKPSDRLMRDVIRSTLVSATVNNTAPHIRHVFLLGAVQNFHEQQLIDKESRKYNDIVQQDFHDSYDNLTLKTMMMLDWATRECHNARYIFKVDQDVYFNVKRVLTASKLTDPTNSNILGECRGYTRPIRTPSKWRISPKEYPQEVYPPMCGGPRYLVPMKVAEALLAESPNTPMVFLEDVYLGLLLAKTPFGVRTTPGLSQGDPINSRAPCHVVDKIVTRHGGTHELARLWKRCFLPRNNITNHDQFAQPGIVNDTNTGHHANITMKLR